jgi:hypothetical protein
MLKFAKIKLTLLIAATLFLSQCKNDFDVNDDWKDISVIYGLISSTDSIHYIRVSKAFLGDEDAYTMAQVSDSLYYQNATVKIEERISGTLTNTFNCVKIDTIREPGVFAHRNFVFATTAALSTNPEATYKLIVFANNKEITSETSLIQDFNVLNLAGSVNLHASSGKLTFQWKTPAMARIFEPVVRFFYYDVTLNTSTSLNDTTLKFLDIPLGSKTSNTKLGGELLGAELIGSSFLTTIANIMPNTPNLIKRVAAKASIEIRISVGSDDMYTYIQVTQPASGIITERPAFTNISNGLGLFTSRYLKVAPKFPSPKPFLSTKTMDSLALGVITGPAGKDLKFMKGTDTQNIWNSFP